MPIKRHYSAVLKIMAKKIIIIYLLAATCSFTPALAEQVATERELRREKPTFSEAESKKIYIHSFYEYSWIKQGSRKGNWRVLSERIAYLNNNLHAPYLDITRYERFGIRDYGLDLGSYFKLKNGYLNGGIGFGADHIDYIYRFKTFVEFERRIINTFFVNLDTKFLDYAQGDVYIFSPGLVYYFGNNYLSASYGISFTEGRDLAQFGNLKANFVLTSHINLWAGIALGERLFDILSLNASKQYGYIFFAGVDINITRNIALRVGTSYSKEQPSFIKRSIDFGAKIKF